MTSMLPRYEEIYSFIYEKLANGWVLITVNPYAVSILENVVYKPGTPCNADFVAVFGPDRYLYMGKKTRKLMKALHQLPGDSFDLLFAVRFTLKNGENIRVETKHFKGQQAKGELIVSLVQSVIELLQGDA